MSEGKRPSLAQMKKDPLYVYYKIVKAAKEGRGTNLTFKECRKLYYDDAFVACADQVENGFTVDRDG